MPTKKRKKAPVKSTKPKKKKAQSTTSFWVNLTGMAIIVALLFYLIFAVINKKPEHVEQPVANKVQAPVTPPKTHEKRENTVVSKKEVSSTTDKEKIKPQPSEEELVLERIKSLSDGISIEVNKIKMEKAGKEVKFFIPIPDQNEDLYFCNMYFKGRMEKEGFVMDEGVETYFYRKKMKINAQKLIFSKVGFINSYSLILYKDTNQIHKTKIAIVVNFDNNTTEAMTDKLLKMSSNLHPAFLPDKKNASEHFKRVKEAGFSCIMRLSMEPIGQYPLKAGKNSILVSDSSKKIAARMKQFSTILPGSSGATNYMGSHATAKREVMEPVIDFLGENDMFFYDSVTTDKSCSEKVAAEKNILYFKKDKVLNGKISNPDQMIKVIDALGRCDAKFIIYEYNCKSLEELNNLNSFIKLAESNGFPLYRLTELRTLQIPKL
ncbi:MAG: divergent polysaccharide deacetylase family protein [Candidatus Cloacimonetes bacterium]|nr:divergent polysaccharide deacetylase family protein [Candidatus Cloacimonadota bacterium]